MYMPSYTPRPPSQQPEFEELVRKCHDLEVDRRTRALNLNALWQETAIPVLGKRHP